MMLSVVFLLVTVIVSNSHGQISSITLLKKVDISNGQRPEIISTQDRIFTVYSVPSEGVGDEDVRVQIFDNEFNYITSKAIITSSIEYGNPNDFRIFSDGQHAYIFYMVSSGKSGSYLFGAKYALDDNFERVAYTGVITNAKRHGFGCTGPECAQEGDERIDDPAPMVAGDYVYVMTGIVSTQSQEGNTIYRLREYDKSLNKLDEFDIDLSDVTDGETGQSSILYEAGYYYIVRATFVEVCENPLQWGCPADIAMIKLDNNWNVVDSKVIADDSYGTDDHNEQYVTGFQTDDNYFYIAYNRAGNGMSSILKVYDKNWNEVLEKELRVSTGGAVRPSIFVSGNSLYSGNHDEQNSIAEVYVYTISGTSIKEPGSITPNDFQLNQNYPNPFNPQTTISYQLPVCSKVTLKIYNMLGKEVRTLVNENKPAGEYSVVWNGKDNSGQQQNPGVYFYSLELDNKYSLAKRMLLLK